MKQEQTRFDRAKLRTTPQDLRDHAGKCQANSTPVGGGRDVFDILTSKRVGTA